MISCPKRCGRAQDKMGFPVPLNDWARGPLREFLLDTFGSASAQRSYLRDDFMPNP